MRRVNNAKENGSGPDSDNDVALTSSTVTTTSPSSTITRWCWSTIHSSFTPASLEAQTAKDKFAGMMIYLARKIGVLLAKLEEEGLARVILAIFDNGINRQIASLRSGHAIKGDEGLPTGNGTHVSLIVRATGVGPPGGVSESLLDFADVLPTLAELGQAHVGSQPIEEVSQVSVHRQDSRCTRQHLHALCTRLDQRPGSLRVRCALEA